MGKIECKECGEFKEHRAKGLCNACYIASYREKNPPVRVSELKRELEVAREEERERIIGVLDEALRKYGARLSCRGDGVRVEIGGEVVEVE